MRPSIIATLSLTFGIVVGFSAQKYFDPAPQPGRGNQKTAGPAQRAQSSRGANHAATPSSSQNLYTQVAQVQRDGLPELAKKILALDPDSPHRAAALDLLMERWVALDAEGALFFAKTLQSSDRDSAFKSALLRLGATGFSNALNWLGENTSGLTRKNAQIWLYTGLARNDPQAALLQIEKMKPGGLKDDTLFTVVSDWAQRDIHAAFAWYKTAPWNEKMPFIYQRLMDSYMRQNPQGTQKLIAQLDDKNYWKKRYTRDLVRTVAESDTSLGMEIASKIQDPQARTDALNEVFEKWSSNAPQQSLDAALKLAQDQTLDASSINDVTRQAAFGLLWENGQAFRAQYSKLPQSVRNEIIGPMVSEWMAEEPRAAESWASQFSTDSIEYNLATKAIADHSGTWDPEEGIKVAQRLTYPELRDSSVYSSLKNLYYKNPQRAIEVVENRNLVSKDIRDAFLGWATDSADDQLVYLIPPSQ